MAAAAGPTLMAGVVSAEVLALTKGVVQAMLLNKLEVCWAVALAVAVSAGACLTYRAVAQEPQEVPIESAAIAVQPAARPAPDDLEALRLEMEALRKEVRALRERVKTLEADARGQKNGDELRVTKGVRGKGAADGQAAADVPEWLVDETIDRDPTVQELRRDMARIKKEVQEWRQVSRSGKAPRDIERKLQVAEDTLTKRKAEVLDEVLARLRKKRSQNEAKAAKEQANKEAAYTLTQAEAAIMMLRQNPNDKQAAEILEQALKRLKEQRKPNATSTGESKNR
jgi:hypothetical protein